LALRLAAGPVAASTKRRSAGGRKPQEMSDHQRLIDVSQPRLATTFAAALVTARLAAIKGLVDSEYRAR
jgi:hypothetical protein